MVRIEAHNWQLKCAQLIGRVLQAERREKILIDDLRRARQRLLELKDGYARQAAVLVDRSKRDMVSLQKAHARETLRMCGKSTSVIVQTRQERDEARRQAVLSNEAGFLATAVLTFLLRQSGQKKFVVPNTAFDSASGAIVAEKHDDHTVIRHAATVGEAMVDRMKEEDGGKQGMN